MRSLGTLIIVWALFVLLFSFGFGACGNKVNVASPQIVQGPTGKDGSPGNPGAAGTDGAPGSSGSNGHSSLVSLLGTAPSCLNGGLTVLSGLDTNDDSILESAEVQFSSVLCNGSDGQPGTPGVRGADGHNALVGIVRQADGGGAGCAWGGITLLSGTDLNDNGVLANAEVGSSAEVCNGQNGVNGADAPISSYSPVGLVDPCGTNPNIFNEVFIRLNNGQMVASFSDNASGANTRFSILKPGNFVTTDGDGCTFSVDSNYQITNENHHY